MTFLFFFVPEVVSKRTSAKSFHRTGGGTWPCSPDTADRTYRRTMDKMRKHLVYERHQVLVKAYGDIISVEEQQ